MRERDRRSALKRVLNDERRVIDFCDDQIFAFSSDRIRSAGRIAIAKLELGEEVVQMARYEAVLKSRFLLQEQYQLPQGFSDAYVGFMHTFSVQYQQDLIGAQVEGQRLILPGADEK